MIVGPLLLHGLAAPRHASCRLMCADELSAQSLANELRRRGLQTALEQLAEDGPSAFKSPTKVIEYVMVCLQHRGTDGIDEAFRFTARPAGSSSFVSGMPLSGRRLSWRTGRFIEGYVSGAALERDAFRRELRQHYADLLGCAAWRWAVLHPKTFEPVSRSAGRDYVREYVIVCDERPLSVRLHYDWGCWCYLIYRVAWCDEEPADEGDAGAEWGGDGRHRDRGGSI